MADTAAALRSIGDKAAFQLANVTKTPPQYGAITPRWLVRLLDWKPLEAGTLRVNRVADDDSVEVVCESDQENTLPASFVNYQEKPREYTLNAISSVLHVSTKISDLYSNPYDQIREQLRLTIESVKERQESELINNAGYGLLKNVPAGQRIKTRTGPPTPDDLDELLTKVWKEPSFFLAHPKAIAAFGRECTRRGVPPGDGHHVRRAVSHLARRAAGSDRQDSGGTEDLDPAAARGREEARGHRHVPAGPPRRADARAFGPLHGNRPELGRVVPRCALLLRGRADRRRHRGSRGRGRG